MSAGPVLAQDFIGKTVLYTAFSGHLQGQVYIAPSGAIYASSQASTGGKVYGLQIGSEFKLGRSTSYTLAGCKAKSSAQLSGNTLTLDTNSICPNKSQASVRDVITFYGDACQITISGTASSPEHGATSYNESADSCRVVSGNKLAQ
jgi:hypothetical protein